MNDAQAGQEALARIRDERRRATRIRQATILAIFIVFGIFAATTIHRFRSFDADALLAHLQQHATARVWPQVATEMDRLARRAVPAISKAFAEEASALLPKLEDRLVAESAVFQNNMNARIQQALDTQFKAQVERHGDEIKSALPRFSGNDDLYAELVSRMETASRQWAQEQLDEVFSEHIQVLQSINESMRRLQAQAKEQGLDETANLDDTLMILMDILNARMGG